MNYLLNVNNPNINTTNNFNSFNLFNNTKQKKEKDFIRIKNINYETHQKEIITSNNNNNNLNIIKISRKPKQLEYSNSVIKKNKINKIFSSSIYNYSIISSNVNMPLIYHEKNRSEDKTNINDKNNNFILKKKSVLEPLKKKYQNE